MPQEIELKLALAPRAAANALSAPAFGRARPARSEPLVSIYYDTEDTALRARGVALRLRQSPRGWTQTVKWGGSASAGLHARGETETAVEQRQIDATALAALPEQANLASLADALKPIFVTEFGRATKLVHGQDGAVIEASLDRGFVIAGARREPICEIELELKSGTAAALYRLALALARDLPLQLDDESKAARGYRLLAGEAAPVKAQLIALGGEASVADGIVAVLRAGLSQLAANRRGFEEGRDPEYLHQMRVAVRRMRSALSLFGDVLPQPFGARLREELRWLGASLGPARDWDVFLGETLPPLLVRLPGEASLAALRAAAESQRALAVRAARRAVASKRYRLLTIGLATDLASPDWRAGCDERTAHALDSALAPFAARVLTQRLRTLRKRGKRIAELDIPALHDLRIRVKKLRYACDFFAGDSPAEKVAEFRACLGQLQDLLGTINDSAGIPATVAELARGRGSVRARALAEGWSAAAVSRDLVALGPAWRRLVKAHPFWD